MIDERRGVRPNDVWETKLPRRHEDTKDNFLL